MESLILDVGIRCTYVVNFTYIPTDNALLFDALSRIKYAKQCFVMKAVVSIERGNPPSNLHKRLQRKWSRLYFILR